jgi:hypothetical protein
VVDFQRFLGQTRCTGCPMGNNSKAGGAFPQSFSDLKGILSNQPNSPSAIMTISVTTRGTIGKIAAPPNSETLRILARVCYSQYPLPGARGCLYKRGGRQKQGRCQAMYGRKSFKWHPRTRTFKHIHRFVIVGETENGWSEISEVLPNTQLGRKGRQEPSGRAVEENRFARGGCSAAISRPKDVMKKPLQRDSFRQSFSL